MLIIRGGINSKKRELCPTALALSAFYYNKNKHADTYIMYLHAYSTSALSINFSEMTASLSGKALVFTPLEYRLLKILTKNPQNVLTRQVLLEKLWDADGNFVDEHALTAAISRVRNKIETDGRQYIKTVYGMGYMWIGGASK